ncbi:hypothetical protein LBW60_18830 [Ralstonia solanacearum]|uniref:hypothetical protein n=1 Tax=Ralstonia solanacearum TaxID=305 RepID=UPI0023050E1D|nr:hypothetical protein [Ralstonia solanacearum]MDB0509446.1 hypothetical protein [Ralstonia solanacearum]MDB0515377.1 hypothetical protein [Ralstonia solanacearum]
MANSMYIPLREIPENIQCLRTTLARALSEFGLTLSDMKFSKFPGAKEKLLDDFVLLEGGEGQQCWISFAECSVELSGRDDYTYMANVQTRGTWDFAGAVAYGLCSMSGYVVFNDAGQLDGQEEYTPEALRNTLLGRLK